MTDSNEALAQLPHKLATLIRSLPQAPFREHLAAECIKQAERIAELESRVHTCGPTCSKAGCINRRLTEERDQLRIDLDDELCNREVLDTMLTQCTAERDQLRAEVEMLRVERERWYTSFQHVSRILGGIHALMYPEPFTLSDGRTVVFRPKDPRPHEILQALSDRIRAIPDEVAAIDHARTTNKDN